MRITFLLIFVFSQQLVSGQLVYDTLLTETAKYIAGLPCETSTFQTLQQKSFYPGHQRFTNDSWQELSDSTLIPMVKWAQEKQILSSTDTGTCFYPFSGPDFLFADQFFPYCKDYLLFGLERLGSITDPRKLNDEQLNNYLQGIREAQRYLLKAGYFVTSHMGKDFSKTVLNGNVHLMCYFLAKTHHKISGIEYGNIGKDGKFITTSYSKGNGIKISFFREGETKIKSLYYFSLDVADYKIKNKPEIRQFILSFPEINTYIKSASYIPAHKNFSVFRTIILDESQKILQDDTGVPIKNIDTTTYTVQLWGTYTKTIKDLSWGYQPELRTALENSGNNVPLPFKISYNGNYGEGMMLYALRKQQ